MWAALAAFEDQEGLQFRVEFNNKALAYFEKELGNVPGLILLKSQANYILFDCGATGKRGKDMLDFALQRGMIFRGESEKYGSDGWFRITVGSEEENKMAVQAVKDFLAGKPA
jgi:histidinol-phosphate aminotransferase